MVEGHQYCEAAHSSAFLSENPSVQHLPPLSAKAKQVVSATLELILTRVWRSWGGGVAAFGGTRFGPNQVAHPPKCAFFIRAKNRCAFFLRAKKRGVFFIRANNRGAFFFRAKKRGTFFIRAKNRGAFFFARKKGAFFLFARKKGALFFFARRARPTHEKKGLRAKENYGVVGKRESMRCNAVDEEALHLLALTNRYSCRNSLILACVSPSSREGSSAQEHLQIAPNLIMSDSLFLFAFRLQRVVW